MKDLYNILLSSTNFYSLICSLIYSLIYSLNN